MHNNLVRTKLYKKCTLLFNFHYVNVYCGYMRLHEEIKCENVILALPFVVLLHLPNYRSVIINVGSIEKLKLIFINGSAMNYFVGGQKNV